MKFEDALKRLEEIVELLDEGDLPLDESLKLFEEGIKLSKHCSQKLDQMQKKVEILKKDQDGALKPEPFQQQMELEPEGNPQ